MKKFLICIMAVCLSYSLYGCGSQNTQEKENNNTTEESQAKAEPVEAEQEQEAEPEPETKSDEEAVAIEFLGKEYHPIDIASGNVTEFITLDFKVKNLTDKDISGIKTRVKFLDVFGEEILSKNFKFDETIPANGEYLTQNMGLNFNQFSNEHVKLKDVSFEKMSMDYTIDKVVYSEQLENLRKELKTGNDLLTVQLTNKIFYPIDIMAGRTDEFLELDLSVKNNSEKVINGFQGVMTFKDIFNDEIMSFNFSDDTTIEANSQIDITGKGLDYNMFISEHSDLKNTPLDKLLFEFKVEKILYSDGTSA